ncbi:MAG TPA: PH domain-containing protein [Sphingobacterium bovisgrunnientis]|nr:PH domain-containing protein [Sphingobacterium bovisgrunnientis]
MLTLLLIPTFIILISIKASTITWITLLLFAYPFITIIYLIAQQTTRYWIENENIYYKSLFMKGVIDIQSIRKLEVNASNWLSNKPATTFTNRIAIGYNKFDDVFVSPEDNFKLVEELLKINPSIEVKYLK